MSENEISNLSFEQAMTELDQVVTKLEQGDVALEDLVAFSERGAALKKHCEDKLKSAQEKIEKISIGPDGAAASVSKVEGL